MTRHQEPLAEQQFKNIQSFKGSKAGDIIPAMHFMCASLKVSCDFCHTEDRASDEKHAKVVAREMIAMQRSINEQNFRGRNEVTCATCHAGHERPVNVPPVEGNSVRLRRSADVSPDQVLAAYGRASGETANAAPVGLRLSGTITLQGKTSPIETSYLGDKFVMDAKLGNGVSKEGSNGNLAWFALPNGVQSVPMAYAAQYVNETIVFTGPSTLPKLSETGGGTAKLDGKDALTVAGTMADGTRLTLFFDKQTGQLERTAYSYPTVLGNIPQINDYSDFRRVGGVLRPMTLLIHSADGDMAIRYRSGRVDPKITAADFDPPKQH